MHFDKEVWARVVQQGVHSITAGWDADQTLETTENFGTHNYSPLRIDIVKAEGSRVWDADGKEYIDCVGAYSAVAHGHLSEPMKRALTEQLGRSTLVSRVFYTPEMALFLQALCEYSEMDMACPMNTGSEAVETCIKLARKWAYTRKGVPADKAEIIVCEGNFHGRTTTIVGFSSEPKYRNGFGPFTPGFVTVPFGDAGALAAAITPNTAAFLAEPIQAEAGVLVPPDGFLSQAKRICQENNILLVWDEVQTGLCRTGRKFAWMHEDAKPDLMAVGKALGGGVYPVSAAVGQRHVMEVFEPGDHGSTFGGNPLASAVAVMALAVMETEDFAEKSASAGEVLRAGFAKAAGNALLEIRGKGLLLGVEFQPSLDPKALQKAFTASGLLTKETRRRTFRFAPPITTDEATLHEIVDRFADAVKSF